LCYICHYTWSCVNNANLAIDDKLIEEARRIGHHKTKKEAVTNALSEYIAHRKRLDTLSSFGTIEFDPNYNYKTARRKKP
jgi:Arc/MetJ family transcription regulator